MSAKPSLEDALKQLLDAVEKSIAWAKNLNPVEGSGKSAKHFFYCPECLRVDVYFKNQVDYAKRKGKRIECFKCKVEMRPVDEHFKAEYERAMRAFYEKVKSILERAWPIMDSWWLWKGVSDYLVNVDLVRVYFDYPTSLTLIREKRGAVKAYLYIHYLDDEEQLEKLLRLISILREEGVKGEVQVDGRSDHCKVPEEKMRAQGFARAYEVKKLPHSDWILEL